MEKDYQLNGRTFSFGTIPPFEAIAVEVAVARVIGEPLFKAFMDKQEPAAAEQAGAAAIGLLLSNMDADEVIKTMKTVFAYVNIDGKNCNITTDFLGKNRELWQVFIAALRFNFSDFLPDGLFNSIAESKGASK